MDYISEIKAFYSFLETHQLSASAIALWHALIHIAVNAGRNKFAVKVSLLEVKAGLKRQAIYDARKCLKENGLIDFEVRKGNQAAIYTVYGIASECQAQFHTQSPIQEIVSVVETQKHTQLQAQGHTQEAIQGNAPVIEPQKHTQPDTQIYVKAQEYLAEIEPAAEKDSFIQSVNNVIGSFFG